MKTLGIIPARYASTRLPAKPLADINGKTMIEWVWEAAYTSKLTKVVVATESQTIFDFCKSKGINVVMTNENHVSGTERVIEVTQLEEYKGYDVIVNIQGDEPMIESKDINELVLSMENWKNVYPNSIGTLVTLIQPHEYTQRSCVKAFQKENTSEIIMFTRSSFYNYDLKDVNRFKKHIGIYAFPSKILENISELKDRTTNEIAESLEQLRWLDNGLSITGVFTSNQTISIDTPEDLDRVRLILK